MAPFRDANRPSHPHQRVALFSSLRLRLMSLVILALLPALGISLFSYAQNRREAIFAVRENSRLYIDLLAANQERVLESARQTLISVSSYREIRQMDPIACRASLASLLSRYSAYTNFTVARPDGKVICSGIPLSGPTNQSHETWFQEAVQSRDFAIGTYLVHPRTQQAVLTCAYPMLDLDGRVQAVLSVGISLGWLNEILIKQRSETETLLPPGSTILVVDQTGKILANFPETREGLGSDLSGHTLVQTMLKQEHGAAESVGPDEIKRLYVFGPLIPTKDNASISIGIPLEQAYLPANRALNSALIGLVLATLVGLTATWVFGRRLVLRDMDALASTARRLATGDLSARTGLKRSANEVGQLAEVFDEMAENLESHTRKLITAEGRYRTLVEQLPAAVYTANLDDACTLQYISPQIEGILGIPMQAWIDQPDLLARYLHPDDRERVLGEVQRCQRKRAPMSIEYRVLTLDGRLVWGKNQSVVVYDPAGQPLFRQGIFLDITAQKQMEMALQESGEQYRSLADSIQDVFFALDHALCFTYWNKASEALTGIHSDEALGKNAYDVVPWVRDSAIEDAVLKAIREQRAQVLVTPMPLLGHVVHLDTHIYPSADGVSVFARDITAQRQAEEARHLDEERLQVLLALNQMTQASMKEITDFALSQAVRLSGSQIGYLAFANEDESELEMISWHLDAGLECQVPNPHTSYPIASTGLWGEAIRQRQPIITNEYTAENPYKHGLPAGHVPVLRHMNVPIFDEDRIVAVAGVGNKEYPYTESDAQQLTLLITGMWRLLQRQQATEALRVANSSLQAVIQSAPLAIFTLDTEGRVQSWNPAAERMFGWKEEDVIGQPLPTVPADQREEHRRLLEQTCLGNALMGKEFLRLRMDNSPVEISLSTAPLHAASGETAGIMAICADISAQKRLQSQLLQSQKMETIGRLAGGVAHDFNNLLTAIGGYASLTLTEPDVSPALRDNIEQILKASNRAANLTRQLLAFARRQIIAPELINLNSLILEMGKMLRRLIGEDIEMSILADPDLGTVKVDPAQMEQVLVNLAVNARDAMPEGGRLRIETTNAILDETYALQHEGASIGSYVCLSVSDSGFGMTEETKQRIFEPFFSTKEAGKGSGLGLATVYGIIKQHGGNIWVYSEPGMGTTFRIYLPRLDEVAKPNDKQAPQPPPPTGHETILLAEDEQAVRQLSARQLRELGYTVLEASDGEEALHVFHANAGSIDLLVTDLVMPRLSGRALAGQVQREHAGLRILFISGYTDDAALSETLHHPHVAFLQKPFALTTLATQVRRLLDV